MEGRKLSCEAISDSKNLYRSPPAQGGEGGAFLRRCEGPQGKPPYVKQRPDGKSTIKRVSTQRLRSVWLALRPRLKR